MPQASGRHTEHGAQLWFKKQTRNYDARRDVCSLDRRVRHDAASEQMFDGDWLLTVAAYNGTAAKAVLCERGKANKARGKPTKDTGNSRKKRKLYVLTRCTAL